MLHCFLYNHSSNTRNIRGHLSCFGSLAVKLHSFFHIGQTTCPYWLRGPTPSPILFFLLPRPKSSPEETYRSCYQSVRYFSLRTS